MGKLRQVLWLRKVRRLFLLIFLGIVAPGVVLAGLGLRGLEGDRIAQEADLVSQHEAIAEQLHTRIRGGIEAVVGPILQATMDLELARPEGRRALEAELVAIQDMFPAVERFFGVSGETWDLVFPVPDTPDEGEAIQEPTLFEIQEAIFLESPRERAEALLDLWTRLGAVRQEHDVRQKLEEVQARLLDTLADDREGPLGDIATRYHDRRFKNRYKTEICERIRVTREETLPGPVAWETLRGDGEPVLYGTVPLAGHNPPYLLGFIIDLGYLEREVLPSVVLAAGRGGARVGVFGDDGRRLLAGMEPGGFHGISLSLGPGLPPWMIQVAGDPDAFHRRFFIRRATLLGLISFLAVALGVGTSLTIRGVLREAETVRARADFVANVSHELRTPLTSIRMFSEMIESGRAPTPEKQREYAHLISREGERLRALIENVMDFSRLERGVAGPERTPHPIGEFVRESTDHFRKHLLLEGFELDVTIQEGLPEVRIDPEGLGRALVNLLANAMKFSEKEKWIGVRAYREGAEVRIEVQDRGPGIPEEEREAIFEKFYRGKGIRVAGCGLGLAIVKAILHSHGGDVRLESRVGEGSTFTMVLGTPRKGETGRRSVGPAGSAPV